jgi:type IV secretory pathway VirB4 component
MNPNDNNQLPNVPGGTPPQASAPQPQYAPPAPGAMPPQPNHQQTTTVKAKSNPNSTQNTLQIAEIRDGIVIMNDGSFRSVVMVKSINFDLMSPAEREAVEAAYQGFLNSLYFDIQIFIRSQKVDLRPYIEKLDKIRSEHDNMLLALLMQDYIGYIDNLSLQTNIMDKKFYLVIPYSPISDTKQALAASKSLFTGLAGLFQNKEQHVVINEADLSKAKDELRNRVQAVLAGLLQCDIQGLPLDTQELIELYYDTYNPDTATRQQLKNFDDLTAPVITKGQGAAPQPNLDKELQ